MFCLEVRLGGGVFGLEGRVSGLEEGRVWLRGASGRILEGGVRLRGA